MPRKRTTEIRKSEIVRAALAIIGEKGVRSLTTAEIGKAAGMSESNLYRHFRGKEEILLAVGDHIGSVIMGTAAVTAGASGKPAEKLERIYFSHVETIARNSGIPRFVFSEEIHLGRGKLAEMMAFRMKTYVEVLSGIIAAGIAEGEIRKGLSPRETAATLLGMIQFTALRHSIGSGSFNLQEEAGRLWENFRRLLSPQDM